MEYKAKNLAECYQDRMKAPSNVWDWQAYDTWRDVLWELLNEVIDENVRAAFLETPPEYVVGDDLSWLDDIVFLVHEINIDSKEFMADKIAEHYSAFRTFHSTRTSNLASYYKNGLQPLNLEKMHQEIRDIFLNGDFPELNPDHIDEAIQRANTTVNVREGRLYFEANERLLINKHADHYKLYGSEYRALIASFLKGPRNYKEVLKENGYPTIFICDVPIRFMTSGTLLEYSGKALEKVFQELLDGANYQPEIWGGAGFCIWQVLPPEYIVGHYHPIIK